MNMYLYAKRQRARTVLFVKTILGAAEHFAWTVQGLGMFRLYFSDEVRLHVWMDWAKRPGVTTIHDHPWSFESEVVFGNLFDRTYEILDDGPLTHHTQHIVCGEGGGALPNTFHSVTLAVRREERAGPGEIYFCHERAIHESVPEHGTVTIITRERGCREKSKARVFYPLGSEWVSAEPRPATIEEVLRMKRDVTIRGL